MSFINKIKEYIGKQKYAISRLNKYFGYSPHTTELHTAGLISMGLLGGLLLVGAPKYLILISVLGGITYLESKVRSSKELDAKLENDQKYTEFAKKTQDNPTFLIQDELTQSYLRSGQIELSSLGLSDHSKIRCISDIDDETVMKNNIDDMYLKNNWTEYSMIDLPINGLFASIQSEVNDDDSSTIRVQLKKGKTASLKEKWEFLLTKNYNLCFTRNILIDRPFESRLSVKKPYLFISKKDNKISVFVHNDISIKNDAAKKTLFEILSAKLDSIALHLKKENKAIDTYSKYQDLAKDLQEQEKVTEETLIKDQFKLTKSTYQSISTLLDKVDIRQLSIADIDSINLVTLSLENVPEDENSEMIIQFKEILNNIIKHQQHIQSDNLLKKDVYYLTERFRNIHKKSYKPYKS